MSEPGRNMSKTFSRWMAFAAAANAVYVIAPKNNPYWAQWETFFTEHGYHTSVQRWCGLGIRDHDTNKPIGRHTRITSTHPLQDHNCQCGQPEMHAEKLRVERRADEEQRGESAPHQLAMHAWAKSIIKLLNLQPKGNL